MASSGSLNNAVRRTALGERNVAPRDTSDAVRNQKPANTHTAASVVGSKHQENRIMAKVKPKQKAFLQPTQRPPRARTIAPSVSMSHIPTVSITTTTTADDTRGIRDALSGSSLEPWVYNDRQEKPKPAPAQPVTPVPENPPAVQEPQVQPSVSTQKRKQEPLLDTTFLDPAPVQPEDLTCRDTRQPSRSSTHTKVSEQGSTSNTQPLISVLPGAEPSRNSRAHANSIESPYLDASENLAQEQIHHMTNAPAQFDSQKTSVGSLPQPLCPESIDPTQTSIPQPDNSASNCNNHTLPSLVDGHAYPSDSDEGEDQYDERGFTTAHSYPSRGDNTTGGVTTVMFPPRITKKGQAELEKAKQIVESRRTAEEIQEDAWDVSMVAEYGDEIFAYMKQQELNLLPNPHYMDNQGEIQWSMRSVLMDWVVQVHTRFGLLPETLFLTVNFIDRFLSNKIVSLGKLQLVGATAIFIAAKYEEINCPSVQEIVYMVDSGYTTEEILKAERFMLSMLDFELGWPGPMSFLRRISKADDYDLETRTLAKYFLEVVIMDERFVASPPSYIAAGAHCLSRLMLAKGEWTIGHVHYSGYTFEQLKPLVATLLDCCRHARKHHGAVFEKYADKRYKQASTYVEEAIIIRGYTLPFEPRLSKPLSDGFYVSETSTYGGSHTNSTTLPLMTHA
ncbi:cyclin-like protein [Astrocystis sublimbata]|nr:cyclin-like protein [Astrocystis sublimbata]